MSAIPANPISLPFNGHSCQQLVKVIRGDLLFLVAQEEIPRAKAFDVVAGVTARLLTGSVKADNLSPSVLHHHQTSDGVDDRAGKGRFHLQLTIPCFELLV